MRHVGVQLGEHVHTRLEYVPKFFGVGVENFAGLGVKAFCRLEQLNFKLVQCVMSHLILLLNQAFLPC